MTDARPTWLAWHKDAGHWAAGVAIQNPGQVSPWIARWVPRVLEPLVRACHRPTLTGVENLPSNGAFLLVANHSAGLGIAEIHTFLVLYLRQIGAARPMAGFALPLGFRVFPLSKLMPALGAIPSTYEAARQTLAAGVPILVFPGGDYETLRPIWQANRVDFGGRKGFLRIARDAGVPIVPLGIRGSHMTAPVLVRSRWLATALVLPRLIGQKRWGLSLLGVLVAAAIAAWVPASWPVRALLIWLWFSSALVFLPWIPWTIRMRIGPAIPAAELFPGGESGGDDELRRALSRVQSAVQTLVDR